MPALVLGEASLNVADRGAELMAGGDPVAAVAYAERQLHVLLDRRKSLSKRLVAAFTASGVLTEYPDDERAQQGDDG